MTFPQMTKMCEKLEELVFQIAWLDTVMDLIDFKLS